MYWVLFSSHVYASTSSWRSPFHPFHHFAPSHVLFHCDHHAQCVGLILAAMTATSDSRCDAVVH
jgi:hypothetical protein